MPIKNTIAGFHEEMTAWRRHLHAHPETAFEEFKTAEFVTEKLTTFGLEVHRGLAGTGVVGVLRRGEGPSIGLRADMDALNMEEENDSTHRSQVPGKMHACGHDGHTTMLLGAAKYLAGAGRFQGTVHFIFQPAEENEGGARVMVEEEKLFEKFPMEAVFGMHNWPQLPAGRIAVRPGPMMAAFDLFEITIHGKGGHGAMPHLSNDPVVIGAQLIQAFQTIVSRRVNPHDTAVLSVTRLKGSDSFNIIPGSAVLGGTVRTFSREVQDQVESAMREMAEHICRGFGATMEFRYERRYPATLNEAVSTERAVRAASAVVGEDNLVLDPQPSMGSEDFAFMLQKKPGSYIWIGAGGEYMVHHPKYDFNDEILPLGASYWAELTEQLLAAG